MRISLVAVGRPRHAGMREAIHDYETRAARYWPLDVVEVKEETARAAAAEHGRDQVRLREGERLMERVPTGARLVACDPGGDALDSQTFSAWLNQLRDAAQSVAFVIGGAYGLSQPILDRADRALLLAPWTLPHELARLVLAEQLYRAGTIVRGEPYHK